MKLLTPGAANAKTAKTGDGALHYILHLLPSDLSGFQVCPAATPGCKAACLNTAGRGRFDSVQQARLRKTQWLFTDRTGFMVQLRSELDAAVRKGARLNLPVVVRLNGTSDLDWRDVIRDYPTIQFYDYTKRVQLLKLQSDDPLDNYHLTYSASEFTTDLMIRRVLALGFNVAVVFAGQMPGWIGETPVILGDGDDRRFLDPPGVIVGLTAKGRAKKDTTGFVRRDASAACGVAA